MRLIIATKNKGKLKEIKNILKGVNIPIISLNELDKKFRIVEDGKTFKENAFKKACPVSKAYSLDYVVAEDSGLQVEFLEGAPGVYSKRYSGEYTSDQKNNLKLLKELRDVPNKKRNACFKCCLVLLYNGNLIKSFEGALRGIIHNEIQGKNGFGYDPVFYLSRYKKTVAQLPLEIKNEISHRAKVFKKLKIYINARL